MIVLIAKKKEKKEEEKEEEEKNSEKRKRTRRTSTIAPTFLFSHGALIPCAIEVTMLNHHNFN